MDSDLECVGDFGSNANATLAFDDLGVADASAKIGFESCEEQEVGFARFVFLIKFASYELWLFNFANFFHVVARGFTDGAYRVA